MDPEAEGKGPVVEVEDDQESEWVAPGEVVPGAAAPGETAKGKQLWIRQRVPRGLSKTSQLTVIDSRVFEASACF